MKEEKEKKTLLNDKSHGSLFYHFYCMCNYTVFERKDVAYIDDLIKKMLCVIFSDLS